MSALLELRDVRAEYGPFRALFGVSLKIEPGGAVALLGANGAGKTTVARVATGLVQASAGQVLVDGSEMTDSPTYAYARTGIVHAPEGRFNIRHLYGRGEPQPFVSEFSGESEGSRIVGKSLRSVPPPGGASFTDGRHFVWRRTKDAFTGPCPGGATPPAHRR